MSFGFDRDRDRKQQELINNKTQKSKFHLRIYSKDFFGFAEHQEKATLGLGYKLSLTRSTDIDVLIKGNAINNAKIKVNALEWHVPHRTPSNPNKAILSEQTLSKVPTGLQFLERSVFMKEVNTQDLGTFEMGTPEGSNAPLWIIVGFPQQNRQDSQNLNNDTFFRSPVTSAQYVIGRETYPDSAISLNYDDDDYYSQGYGQIKEAFRALTKDDIPKPYISEHDFRSTNSGDDIGYNLYVFHIRHQKNLESGRPINTEFKFSENTPAGKYGYALVLTNKLFKKTSDGQRHFHLI